MVVRRAAEHHRRARGRRRAGGSTRASTTVATRAPARSARRRYSWSSPQMKNSSRGSADPLDQLAGDQHAVEGDHDVRGSRRRRRPPRRRPSGARRGCRRAAGSGSTSRSGSASSTHDRAPEVEVVARARAAGRGSRASGRPSSSISQTRSAPRSIAQAQPVVEAAGAAAVGRAGCGVEHGTAPVGRGSAASQLPRAVGRGVVDDQHLVEPRHLAQPRRPAAGAAPSRLKVTTTATMRGVGVSSVTAHSLSGVVS